MAPGSVVAGGQFLQSHGLDVGHSSGQSGRARLAELFDGPLDVTTPAVRRPKQQSRSRNHDRVCQPDRQVQASLRLLRCFTETVRCHVRLGESQPRPHDVRKRARLGCALQRLLEAIARLFVFPQHGVQAAEAAEHSCRVQSEVFVLGQARLPNLPSAVEVAQCEVDATEVQQLESDLAPQSQLFKRLLAASRCASDFAYIERSS